MFNLEVLHEIVFVDICQIFLDIFYNQSTFSLFKSTINCVRSMNLSVTCVCIHLSALTHPEDPLTIHEKERCQRGYIFLNE